MGKHSKRSSSSTSALWLDDAFKCNSQSRRRAALDYMEQFEDSYDDFICHNTRTDTKATAKHQNQHNHKDQKAKGPTMTEPMKPRNANQAKYITMMSNPLPYIVIASGPAGTAKSSLAVSVAIQELLKHNYSRIVITRPTVSADEDVGFLPGKLEDKMDPWLRPLYDTFYKYYTPDAVKDMIAKKVIDICPIAYLRGRTLEDSFIIVDEAQNCSVNQMLMILTRIGPNSKMVITGDPMQHDRKPRTHSKNVPPEKSGLTDLIDRLSFHTNTHAETYSHPHQDQDQDPLRTMDECESESHIDRTHIDSNIGHVVFDASDVERHPVIKDILHLYSL